MLMVVNQGDGSTMRPQAKPGVNFFIRVDLDTDDRRRRLQERTGLSAPRLIADALREFEAHLETRLRATSPGVHLKGQPT
jgi:hypothetical protein